jgi:hypothetical protein
LKAAGANLEEYIEDMENRKDSPFYNENKRKKKMKSLSYSAPNASSNIMSMSESTDIELDF